MLVAVEPGGHGLEVGRDGDVLPSPGCARVPFCEQPVHHLDDMMLVCGHADMLPHPDAPQSVRFRRQAAALSDLADVSPRYPGPQASVASWRMREAGRLLFASPMGRGSTG